jgi:hypothetical protein
MEKGNTYVGGQLLLFGFLRNFFLLFQHTLACPCPPFTFAIQTFRIQIQYRITFHFCHAQSKSKARPHFE